MTKKERLIKKRRKISDHRWKMATRKCHKGFSQDFVSEYRPNPYNIEPYGNCPVQAEGQLKTGEWYYFRARGSHWQLRIAKGSANFFDNSIWVYEEEYADGEEFAAGWMSKNEAIFFATKALDLFYKDYDRNVALYELRML